MLELTPSWLWVVLVVLAAMSGCGPSDEQKAAWAERQRTECLDKICQGDVEPKFDWKNDALLKLNGQWYVGPKEFYSSGGSATGFEWWNHKPASRAMKRPSELQSAAAAGGYGVLIEMFFSSREGWGSPPSAKKMTWQGRWTEIEQSGFVLHREKVGDVLEFLRFESASGEKYDRVYWVLKKDTGRYGESSGVASCEVSAFPHLDTCTGGWYFDKDRTIYMDFRFNARHAQDWPAIYKEMQRVLSLLKKVEK